MVKLTDPEIKRALERGKLADQTEPRATSARLDTNTGNIIIELKNGCTFAFPSRLVQGLAEATERQLSTVEILGEGYALHWEELDVDISVPGLLAGKFGTQKHMARLAGDTI